jgi:glycosyltransferase involved in cell wall biosynthesis
VRIAFSCGSPNRGGLERMAVELSRGLAGRGHDIVILCRPDAPVHRALRGELPCEPVLGGGDVNPIVIARARTALRRHRPDLVIGNMYKDPRWTGVAARTLGLPFIYRQEIDEPYGSGWYYRAIYSIPVLHIVNSRATRHTLLRSAPYVPPERVVVIPNGIDVERYATTLHRAELGLPHQALVFGYTGRWEAGKGVFDLAAAWPRVAAALPEAHLVIAGWGPEEARLRAALAGAPRVLWHGDVDDMPPFLKALDVLVLPTHREGFGLAIIEGMAAGTPVITTRASSIPDLLEDGVQGRLVPVADPAALAAAMIATGSDARVRERMGRAGQRRAREFSLARMLDGHERVLDDVARGRLPSPGDCWRPTLGGRS